MKKSLRLFALLVTLIMLSGTMLACAAPVEEAEPAVEEEAAEVVEEVVEEEAKVEGDLMIYTSSSEAFISEVVAKFNEKYPDVHAEYFRSGTEEVISKLMAENMTNSIQADVIMVSDGPTFESLKANDLLVTYDSPMVDQLYTDFVDPEHYYYGTFPGSMGIIYNTNLVETAPSSWLDLLDPALKGNVIMPNPLYSGTAANMLLEMVRAEGLGWEFYEGLLANDVMIVNGNGGVISSVTAGEMAYGICFDADAYTAKANGSPVDYVYPSEGSPATADPIGILKTTDNTVAAQAFVEFMLSEEIQAFGRDVNGRTPINKNVPVLEGRVALDDRTTLISDAKELYTVRDEQKAEFAALFGL
ncbi:MAG: ABC transporter substrate-binding protein [Clostridia bacterium]|nr:ABC transporter substrate-binding protein [Clostridia bacterium]